MVKMPMSMLSPATVESTQRSPSLRSPSRSCMSCITQAFTSEPMMKEAKLAAMVRGTAPRSCSKAGCIEKDSMPGTAMVAEKISTAMKPTAKVMSDTKRATLKPHTSATRSDAM